MVLKSPLNYVGGKYRTVGEIVKHFPKNVKRLCDLFCGGCNVSLNTPAQSYWLNDAMQPLANLYSWLKKSPDPEADVEILIAKYGISKTNRDGFLRLRQDYNADHDPAKLFVLVTNSFNHQLRFNSAGEFNMPFGFERSHFNPKMRQNLRNLIAWLKASDVTITSDDFRTAAMKLTPDDFLYCDPPYTLTTAAYNAEWTAQDDLDLLAVLDEFASAGGKFALSAAVHFNGAENQHITDWAGKYHVVRIEWRHTNPSYHKKQKPQAKEVLVLN